MKLVEPGVWELESESLPVQVLFFGTEKIISEITEDVVNQIKNVTKLPGIKSPAIVMPDGHAGYGFPIGGVAAFNSSEGVISPGLVGFDINCGVRLIKTPLTIKEVRPKLKELVNELFKTVPAGVGRGGFLSVSKKRFRELITIGVEWCVENGFAEKIDLKNTENNGKFDWADPDKISDKAIKRGIGQVGTLGAGNHYLEIQHLKPENIFNKELAEKWGLFPDQVVVMVHCGSRGFGHQVATDYIKRFNKLGLDLPDPQLSYAPFQSDEGQDYYAAMACGANMAFANRQLIQYRVKQAFKKLFNEENVELLYDVAHNTAKVEKHNGEELIVHRKGSTRAFPPGREELENTPFSTTGHPVLIGGSMQTSSYVLVGTEKGLKLCFGSSAHGAGRTMSRTQARKSFNSRKIIEEMNSQGVVIQAVSLKGLAEEAGKAYKNVDEVVKSCELSGISEPVVKLLPIGNIKG